MLKKPILLRTIILLVGLSCFVLIATSAQTRKNTTNPTDSAYAASVAQLDQEISSLTKRAEGMPNSWFALELVAQKHLDRAKLTGNYNDYLMAETLLDKAFELSGVGGAHMTRASLNYSLHRLSDVTTDLSVAEKRIILTDPQESSILGLQADINFYQGNYETAFEGYQEALALSRNSTNLFRLAVYYWYTGNFDLAEKFINEAALEAQDLSPRLTAFFHLHRGLFDLDRGRYEEALVHYEAADAAFGGWWLIAEHIAEIYVIEGNLEEAKAIYETVIFETANPEFMDALAGISDSEQEAANWSKQATAAYERQLQQLPEASYGHALGHYLEAGNNTKALELAKANYELRPYGEAEILLAQAYLQAGQLENAQTLIEASLASVWNSAELHATAALIFEASGNKEKAELERLTALSINPDALDNLSWLAADLASLAYTKSE